MLYRDLLEDKNRPCPFCDPKDRIILERETAFMTYNLAPFCRHHAMVMPKRHIEHVRDFSDAEWRDMNTLITEGTGLLYRLGYTFVSIFMRDGKHPGKSVEHIHCHLVPDMDFRPEHDIARAKREDHREVLTPEQIAKTLADFARAKNS